MKKIKVGKGEKLHKFNVEGVEYISNGHYIYPLSYVDAKAEDYAKAYENKDIPRYINFDTLDMERMDESGVYIRPSNSLLQYFTGKGKLALINTGYIPDGFAVFCKPEFDGKIMLYVNNGRVNGVVMPIDTSSGPVESIKSISKMLDKEA